MGMLFKHEQELADYVEGLLGGTLYLVGGAVRDELLNQEPHDRDYVVTELWPDQLHFSKVVGSDFPVFEVVVGGQKCEVAMARTEKKKGKGYKGFLFHSSPSVTIEEDLARRDLTVNSIAKHVRTGEVIDPFHGKDDLLYGLLRHTSPAFAEDPTRVFRVARFAAKFPEFEISNDTMTLMRKLRTELSYIEPQQVWREMEKAMQTDYPSRFFRTLYEVGGLVHFFPEVKALDVPDKHDGTAFYHTMRAIDLGTDVMERMGLFFHDFGKGLTPKRDHPSHHGHEKLGALQINKLCFRLRIPNRYRDFGLLCAREHMRAKRVDEMRSGKLIQWLNSVSHQAYDLIRIAYLDSIAREGADTFAATADFVEITRQIDLAFYAMGSVSGDHLIEEGYTPGKDFGQLLLQRQVDVLKEVRS